MDVYHVYQVLPAVSALMCRASYPLDPLSRGDPEGRGDVDVCQVLLAVSALMCRASYPLIPSPRGRGLGRGDADVSQILESFAMKYVAKLRAGKGRSAFSPFDARVGYYTTLEHRGRHEPAI